MDDFARVNSLPWEVAERVISLHRLESYLQNSEGEKELAISLYQWNSELSIALWQLISFLEVALRNTIDLQLSKRSQKNGRYTHWIFDENGELGRRESFDQSLNPYREIYKAIDRVRKNGKEITPQQVISETSLGFWHQLVSNRKLAIWPDLAGAFPSAPSRDQSYISELIKDLRKLRNRISHHHRLHPKSVEQGELMILELAKAIDPDFSLWLAEISSIGEVKGRQPQPGWPV